MAAKNNEIRVDNLRELKGEWQPERIVINAGTSFGTALSYIVLGAALGATATIYMLKNRTAPATSAREETLRETERGAARLRNRLTSLSSHIKDLAGRAREAAHIVNEQVRPAMQEAFREAVEEPEKAKNDDKGTLAEVAAHPS